MKLFRAVLVAVGLCAATCAPASAQQPPPRIGPFVVDLRGTFPFFPGDAQLAQSRGVTTPELPGTGIGVDVGAHVYVFKWRAITFGVGGELMTGRSHSAAVPGFSRAVSEHFTTLSPQISLNFGKGTGWSFLSGGVGPGTWSIIPAGAVETPADQEQHRVLNYGGGARWFAKRHLAFTFDVRFYAISAGTPQFGFPGSPHTSLLVLGAGISVR